MVARWVALPAKCMEAIEELAINTSEVQPKVWKRYVDVNSFHATLNSIDPHISFSGQQIAFLDTLDFTQG